MRTKGMTGLLPLILAAVVVLGLAPSANADKTPTQAAFHAAFVRMDARWPNVSSHDYWLALRDAEDLLPRLTPAERTSDPEVARDVRAFRIYKDCWLALLDKERAMREMAVGELLLAQHPADRVAAREHFALAVASWDEAFRLWPYFASERVLGERPDQPVGTHSLVGTASQWRARAQRLLALTR